MRLRRRHDGPLFPPVLQSRFSVLHARVIGQFGFAHNIVALQLTAKLGAQALGGFFLVVLHDDLEEQVGTHVLFYIVSRPSCFYTGDLPCAICQTRKPRRYCLGVRAEICTVCCGTEREQSIDCPLECEFLHEAHRREKAQDPDPATMPNADIRVTEQFLVENEVLLAFIAVTLFEAWLETRDANDWDLRETFEALTRTYRSLDSGIYYEARPDNVFAARIAAYVQEKIAELRAKETAEREVSLGDSGIRDSALLGVLVFLQRIEFAQNNGRKRSRAFLDFLRGF